MPTFVDAINTLVTSMAHTGKAASLMSTVLKESIKDVKDYNAAVKEAVNTTAGMTKGSKGGSMGADSGSSGGTQNGMSAAEVAAALKSVTGRR